MEAVVYEFRNGSHLSRQLNPQACGERIETLRAKHGEVRPEMLVDDAKSKRSPLHNAFEWDDTEAARQHRLSQARHLIRSISVRIITPAQTPVVVPAFTNLDPHTEKQSYRSTVQVMSDAELRAQMLSNALRELQILRRKYAELSELALVFDTIDRLSATG